MCANHDTSLPTIGVCARQMLAHCRVLGERR